MEQLITGVIIESLTLEEFSRAVKAKREVIIEMVEYNLFQPEGQRPDEWRFDSISLKKGKIAASFYQDLEVNMQGVALALELMDKIENLQQQLTVFEKLTHPKSF
jgi:chaperone modulatory protein CbpM